jgi:hypothetical protein
LTSVWFQPVRALISAIVFCSRSRYWIDHPVLGLEPLEQLLDELAGRERVVRGDVVLVRDRGVEDIGLALGKVRPAQLRPALLRAQVVDAGRDRDPRHPVGEGHVSLVLVDSREHLQKYVLGKVFLGDPAGKVGARDPDDEGMEVLHKLPRSNLIAFAHAIKTASQIKRLVVRHVRIEASSGTYCKTPVAAAGLPESPGSRTPP